MKHWTDSDLRDAFDLFNSRYFGGRLEVVYVRFDTLPDGKIGHTKAFRAEGSPDRFAIRISERLRGMRCFWASTLLHEMVHVKQENRYGCGLNCHNFNREMKRLAEMGAFNGIW